MFLIIANCFFELIVNFVNESACSSSKKLDVVLYIVYNQFSTVAFHCDCHKIVVQCSDSFTMQPL